MTCCFEIARTHLLLLATLLRVSNTSQAKLPLIQIKQKKIKFFTNIHKQWETGMKSCASVCMLHAPHIILLLTTSKQQLAFSQASSIGSDGVCPNLEVFATDLCHRCAPTKHHKQGKQQAIALVAMNMGSFSYIFTSSTRTSRGRKFPVYKKKHKPIRSK